MLENMLHSQGDKTPEDIVEESYKGVNSLREAAYRQSDRENFIEEERKA